MQLLDLSDHLPGLPRLPGLKKWYARDKVQYYETWEEACEVGFLWHTERGLTYGPLTHYRSYDSMALVAFSDMVHTCSCI